MITRHIYLLIRLMRKEELEDDEGAEREQGEEATMCLLGHLRCVRED